MRARRSIGAVIVLALALASCARKAPTLPAAAAAPRFADFVFPDAPAGLAPPAVTDRQRAAWQLLQGGDAKGAERDFTAILKQTPAFYPAEAGLGYAALSRKDAAAALPHFDKVLGVAAGYAPALAGKGEALLAVGRTDAAADAFAAAVAADPGLASLRGRIDVLKFRGVQQNIENARKAAAAGKADESKRAYLAAIAASPESAFLYRELAAIEHKGADDQSALAHARQAATLDPADARALLLVGEILESSRDWIKAADAYAAANAIEPTEGLALRIDEMRERAAFESMPAEYKTIGESPTLTRAQLAAMLGIQLGDVLRGAANKPLVVTDVRASWAAPWIQSVTRAGIMDPFPNHTFQPNGLVRRADLAQAVSRVLTLIAAGNPRLASRWRDSRPRFADVSPGHLLYPAAARAVSAGVMTPLEGETFQLTRPVTGAEARDTVARLAALARK